MQRPLFNPFQPLNFQPDICFLTGQAFTENQSRYSVPVFPEWLLRRYEMGEKKIEMLGGNRMKYQDMLLPASEEVVLAIDQLDAVTQEAFEQGYEAVKALPELTLFQWMARVMYGVLYQDFTHAILQHEAQGRTLRISPLMQQKLRNLLFMLQSLVRPVQFAGFTPWSIKVCRVNVSRDILNYKDETHKLNFCLGMNGFGVAACLQDNGEVARFYQDILEKIGDVNLHPAQFEELYGRFMYANYLLREIPDYLLHEKEGAVVFELPDASGQEDRPLYAPWDDKIFAQVLANMWEPWGLPIGQIYQFPNSPVSLLINEHTHQLIAPEAINLDY